MAVHGFATDAFPRGARESACRMSTRAEALEHAGGVHRVSYDFIWALGHEFLFFLRRHGLAPVATKFLAGGDEKRHPDEEHRQSDDAQRRPDRCVIDEAEQRHVRQREGGSHGVF